MDIINIRIKEKVIKYYSKLYKDFLCLPDYKDRINNRLNEEKIESKRIEILSKLINYDFNNKKNLIVGAGTGGLAVILNNIYKCNVYGVEPNQEALEITHLKCKSHNLNPEKFTNEYAEKLPFNDNTFDFVHCYTVLEHVQNTKKTIQEMIRVLKPKGKIYINTPNYNFPYEGHYKIPFPTFLPKFFGYIYLILLGKSFKFYKTINKVTIKKIDKILLRQQNITWQRHYNPPKKYKGKMSFIFNFFLFWLGIYQNQVIIVEKI